MKIFHSESIRVIDAETIQKEGIASHQLMERAAKAFVSVFCTYYKTDRPVIVYCGTGNNGGDGLAIARLLLDLKYAVIACLTNNKTLSDDCNYNKKRLTEEYPGVLTEINSEAFGIFSQNKSSVIIEAIFGTGLSRSVTGTNIEVISQINSSGFEIVSVDIPSGLKTTAPFDDVLHVVKAQRTISFEFPKIPFLLPETGKFCGNWTVVPIGLNKESIQNSATDYTYFDIEKAVSMYKKRETFSHKGTFGHALIVAGSKGMAGSAVLAGKAALRTGCGLVTIHGPELNRIISQTACPEIIFHSQEVSHNVSMIPELQNYDAIGIGCGIGKSAETQQFFETLLQKLCLPCVIDADGLNIIAQKKHLLKLLPESAILTPHPKEFDRLFGEHKNTWQRIEKAQNTASELGIIIVLKGKHTAVISPDKQVSFNSTGNSGMATAGTGDVLTGIICSLLAQGYNATEAAKLGVYMHGLAADCALETQTEESLIAGDIISNMAKAWSKINFQKRQIH